MFEKKLFNVAYQKFIDGNHEEAIKILIDLSKKGNRYISSRANFCLALIYKNYFDDKNKYNDYLLLSFNNNYPLAIDMIVLDAYENKSEDFADTCYIHRNEGTIITKSMYAILKTGAFTSSKYENLEEGYDLILSNLSKIKNYFNCNDLEILEYKLYGQADNVYQDIYAKMNYTAMLTLILVNNFRFRNDFLYFYNEIIKTPLNNKMIYVSCYCTYFKVMARNIMSLSNSNKMNQILDEIISLIKENQEIEPAYETILQSLNEDIDYYNNHDYKTSTFKYVDAPLEPSIHDLGENIINHLNELEQKEKRERTFYYQGQEVMADHMGNLTLKDGTKEIHLKVDKHKVYYNDNEIGYFNDEGQFRSK